MWSNLGMSTRIRTIENDSFETEFAQVDRNKHVKVLIFEKSSIMELYSQLDQGYQGVILVATKGYATRVVIEFLKTLRENFNCRFYGITEFNSGGLASFQLFENQIDEVIYIRLRQKDGAAKALTSWDRELAETLSEKAASSVVQMYAEELLDKGDGVELDSYHRVEEIIQEAVNFNPMKELKKELQCVLSKSSL